MFRVSPDRVFMNNGINMYWIKVTEQLPPPGYMLVFCPEYTNHLIPIMAQYRQGKNGMVFWDYDSWNDNDITEYVTHWCPIPELPKT